MQPARHALCAGSLTFIFTDSEKCKINIIENIS